MKLLIFTLIVTFLYNLNSGGFLCVFFAMSHKFQHLVGVELCANCVFCHAELVSASHRRRTLR